MSIGTSKLQQLGPTLNTGQVSFALGWRLEHASGLLAASFPEMAAGKTLPLSSLEDPLRLLSQIDLQRNQIGKPHYLGGN